MSEMRQTIPNPMLNHQHEPPALEVAATRPDVDPCDIACDAMPAHLLAELPAPDEAWLREHVADCGSCRRQLAGYDLLGATLDEVVAPLRDLPAPTVVLPRERAGTAPPTTVWTAMVASPIGPLLLAATETGLCEIAFARSRSENDVRAMLVERGLAPRPLDEGGPAEVRAIIARATEQLAEYFNGSRRRFDLPLDFRGVTPFTRSVLEATAAVDFGRLETYRGIASRIGKPKASRAVGGALGRNPLPVVVPCHRIVRAGGGLGGYTGGLWIKERLLAIEGVAFAS